MTLGLAPPSCNSLLIHDFRVDLRNGLTSAGGDDNDRRCMFVTMIVRNLRADLNIFS